MSDLFLGLDTSWGGGGTLWDPGFNVPKIVDGDDSVGSSFIVQDPVADIVDPDNPTWAAVDTGAVTPISSVRVVQGDAGVEHAGVLYIDGSDNGTDWDLLAIINPSSEGENTASFDWPHRYYRVRVAVLPGDNDGFWRLRTFSGYYDPPPPPDPYFGQGYPGDTNKPSRLRVATKLGGSDDLTDITNSDDYYIDRESVRIERSNEDGSAAIASFDLICPNGPVDLRPNRYIGFDDPDTDNGLGGPLGVFAGYIMTPDSTNEALENKRTVRCVDYGVLALKPPKQITTQWPPGDGTPVVDISVPDSLTAGSAVTVHGDNVRNLYPGKRVLAQNSDGSNPERITIISVDYDAGTFVADFASDKTSSSTTVPTAMHATGYVDITPDDMTNLNPGSLIYAKKHHGNQEINNEYTTIVSVTSTTFNAYFNSFKTHGWEVQAYWRIIGGISDKELITDGWKQHVDTLDPDTGLIVTTLDDIPSLLNYCYRDEGFPVDGSAVEEITLSLPHGKWESATPADVLNWVVAQKIGNDIDPRWYMTFAQPTDEIGPIEMAPRLRYYDALSSEFLATIVLTDDAGSLDYDTQARYGSYNRPEDGQGFANKLTVMGANSAKGVWVDPDSISNNAATNYVGRTIEAAVVRDNSVSTNAGATDRATQLAETLKLSVRRRTVNTWTYARLSPTVLYEPQSVSFEAANEDELPETLEVRQVALSFEDQGRAKYSFTLGDKKKIRGRTLNLPRVFRRANVFTNPSGALAAAGSPTTRYITEHSQIGGDADLYVVDTSDDAISCYLPPAGQNPGLVMEVKVPESATQAASIYPVQRNGILDTIDGANSLVLSVPGQTVRLQSAGEYDTTGKGGIWHVTSTASQPTTLPNPLILPEIATPDPPPVAALALYSKFDENLYYQRSDGTEIELATGSGAGGVGATDGFNRADGPIGSTLSGQSWLAPVGTVEIVSNKAVVTDDGAVFAQSALFDGYVEALFSTAAAGQRLYFRSSAIDGDFDDTEGLYIECTGSTYHLCKRVAGTESLIYDYSSDDGDLAASASAGDLVAVWFRQHQIVLYIWGVPYSSVNVSDLADRTMVGIGGPTDAAFDYIQALPIDPSIPLMHSVNLPVFGGGSPVVAGLYIPVGIDFDCRVHQVQIICLDSSGAFVSDTVNINIKRLRISGSSVINLNPSPFGPSGANHLLITAVADSGWTTLLNAGEYVMVEVVDAPSTAVTLGVNLGVLRI